MLVVVVSNTWELLLIFFNISLLDKDLWWTLSKMNVIMKKLLYVVCYWNVRNRNIL